MWGGGGIGGGCATHRETLHDKTRYHCFAPHPPLKLCPNQCWAHTDRRPKFGPRPEEITFMCRPKRPYVCGPICRGLGSPKRSLFSSLGRGGPKFGPMQKWVHVWGLSRNYMGPDMFRAAVGPKEGNLFWAFCASCARSDANIFAELSTAVVQGSSESGGTQAV